MAQLLVRGLKEEIVRRLRIRAAGHGRTVEAEHRAILEEAVRRPLTTADAIALLRRSPIAGLDAEALRERADGLNERRLADFIGAGKGVHDTHAEADANIRKLRDEWET